MKYATKRNIKKLLKIYKDAYYKVKDMNRYDAYDYLDKINLEGGICWSYSRYIGAYLIAQFNKEFGFNIDDYKWSTPEHYIYRDKHPKLGLTPRIKHLEKLYEKSH